MAMAVACSKPATPSCIFDSSFSAACGSTSGRTDIIWPILM